MKSKLQQALYELDQMERTSLMQSPLHLVDARAKLTVTLVFLLCMLSLPLKNLSEMMLYFAYPIVASAMAGVGYGHIFSRSLIVLPFVLLIGLFNPLYDREVVFYVGNIAITSGWVSFVSIVVRGLLSVQALLLLIYSTGFYNLCRVMQRMGVPSIFTTQLLFVYRYLSVLINESLSMSRARESRSFGRKSFSVKVWAVLIGQLMIRTFERAEHINRAMLSRGFTGRINVSIGSEFAWRGGDTWFLVVWCVVLVAMRLLHPIEYFISLI